MIATRIAHATATALLAAAAVLELRRRHALEDAVELAVDRLGGRVGLMAEKFSEALRELDDVTYRRAEAMAQRTDRVDELRQRMDAVEQRLGPVMVVEHAPEPEA